MLSEEERRDLITFLAYNPAAGEILRGTGGIRKIRWAREGEGKSGGFRVVYFCHSTDFIPLMSRCLPFLFLQKTRRPI